MHITSFLTPAVRRHISFAGRSIHNLFRSNLFLFLYDSTQYRAKQTGCMAEQPEGKAAEAQSAPAPDAKAVTKEINTSRRRIVWACIWGYLGVNFLMFLRFFFPRALYEPNTIFNIGYPADFALGIDQRFLTTKIACGWCANRTDVVIPPAARTWAARRSGKPRKISSNAPATAAGTTTRE